MFPSDHLTNHYQDLKCGQHWKWAVTVSHHFSGKLLNIYGRYLLMKFQIFTPNFLAFNAQKQTNLMPYHSSHFTSLALFKIPVKFPSTLTQKMTRPERLNVFLKMKKEGKPHQEEVKGDIFHFRTKVPFMRQLGRIQEHPQRGENVGFSLHPLSSFSDLKINKRQVQQHRRKSWSS